MDFGGVWWTSVGLRWSSVDFGWSSVEFNSTEVEFNSTEVEFNSTELHRSPPNSTEIHLTPPNSNRSPPNSTEVQPKSTELGCRRCETVWRARDCSRREYFGFRWISLDLPPKRSSTGELLRLLHCESPPRLAGAFPPHTNPRWAIV